MTRLDAKSSQSQREEAILNNFHNWTKRKGPLLLHRKGASQIWESIAAGKSIVNPEKGHESEGNPGFGCEPESHFAGPARRSSCARSARNRNSKTCNASNVERVCSFSNEKKNKCNIRSDPVPRPPLSSLSGKNQYKPFKLVSKLAYGYKLISETRWKWEKNSIRPDETT